MIIELQKGKQKPSIVCSRKDGSRTWRKSDTLILRDLACYAVETNLCYNMGFYGLIRAGVDVGFFVDQEFNPSEIPLDAFYSDRLVKMLLREINERELSADFQRKFDEACENAGRPTQLIEHETLDKIRSQIKELYGRWKVLRYGEKLTLEFTIESKDDCI